MAPEIAFSEYAIAGIRGHLYRSFPEEGCGFFFGKDGNTRQVTHFLETENVFEGERKRRFSIRPEDYLLAEHYALENELDLLGIYHSHPNHPAIPSETDRLNAVPWFSYLIITTTITGATEARSWQLNPAGTFEEERLIEHATI
jgi:proteasome lid subunit RPN8/RPN11